MEGIFVEEPIRDRILILSFYLHPEEKAAKEEDKQRDTHCTKLVDDDQSCR
jgi:hypothetical protein